MALNQQRTQEFATVALLKAVATQPLDNDKFFFEATNLMYDYDATNTTVDDGVTMLSLNSFAGRFQAVLYNKRAIILASIPQPSGVVVTPIGTALLTVDIADIITITQATDNSVFSIPTPTTPKEGQDLVIYNNGLFPFAIQGAFLEVGEKTTFTRQGGTWRPDDLENKPFSVTGVFTGDTTPTYSPNSGLNTTVNGIVTMPADTISYFVANGNYVTSISLPTAVGRTGYIAVSRFSSFGFSVMPFNSDLGQSLSIGSNLTVYFEAINGRWRWRPSGGFPIVADTGYDANVVPATAAYTALVTDLTIVMTTVTTLTLPVANTVASKTYVLVNPTATARAVSAYTDFTGLATQTVVPANGSITLQSIAGVWRRIV